MVKQNSKYNQVCKRCGRYCGGTCADQVFNSSKRQLVNGGYTQQNTKGSDDLYTGIDHSDDNNDIFFSTEKYTDDKALFSKESKTNHNPNDNPYDNNVYKEHKWHVQSTNITHTEEYRPNDIIEFSKHRFGSEFANKIRFRLIGLIATTLFMLFSILLIDKTHLSYPIISIYSVVIIGLTFLMLRSFKQNVMLTIVGITLAYSIALSVILITTHLIPMAEGLMTPINFLIIYGYVIGQYVFCFLSYKAYKNFSDRWDAYCVRGVYVNKDEVDDTYEIYGTNSDENQT